LLIHPFCLERAPDFIEKKMFGEGFILNGTWPAVGKEMTFFVGWVLKQ
jgi:hypothetical protein